jgi:hypothetical protein
LSQWWEMPELDAEARLEMKLAFWNVFYGSAEGRQVMLKIKEMCYRPEMTSKETLAKIRLFHDIRAICGNDVNSAMASIEAEGKAINLGDEDAGND